MNMKGLMAGTVLAILILTTTGAALDFNAAFSAVYGQVTDGGAGVNGAAVSLTANGVTITTKTMTNNRGEPGFYIFELANIPNLADTTPLTLTVTTGTKTATTTITRGGNDIQKVDLVPQTSGLTTITVTPADVTLVAGSTQTFTATDQNGNPIGVTWNSSNNTVGTINAAGVFTASSEGTTTIIAMNGTVVGSTAVTVIAPQAAYQITVEPVNPVVNNPLNVTVLKNGAPEQGIMLQFILNGGQPVFAATDSQGKVRFIPLAPGTLDIYASTRNGIPLANISISVAPPAVPPPATYQITVEPVNLMVNNILNVAVLRDGAPAQGILLQFILNGGTPVLAATDSRGEASFIPLLPGTLNILATTMDGVPLANISVTVLPPSFTVAIEVRDSINPGAQGVIRVAILNNTPQGFDVATIDIPTVRFEEAPVVENVTEGNNNLLLHFNVQDTGIECGDTQVTLTGKTRSGQDIVGTAGIVTVGCPGRGAGGGSGGGGVTTAESLDNIERYQTAEMDLKAGKPVTYRFAPGEGGIYELVVTGSENENAVPIRVEHLKGISRLVTAPAEGNVYYYVNVWAGTKRIKEAVMRFRVENSWLETNGLKSSDIRMLRWDGSKWAALETRETNKDDKYTFLEAVTGGFSHFAVTGMKGEATPAALVEVTPPEITPSVTAPAAAISPEAAPPINLGFVAGVIVLIAVVVVLYIRKKK